MAPDQSVSFLCDMSAIAPEERRRHITTIRTLFGEVQEVRELSVGYAFRLANEDRVLLQVAAFITKERLCCPFFGFRIELEPKGGALWLSITGPEGVKPFIRAEIGEALPETIVREAGFSDSAT